MTDVPDVTKSLAWNLYVELRKEVLSTQALRSRTIELKIGIVGAAIALFFSKRGDIHDDRFLVLPAFVAMFFDFLIASYSFAIKRKGKYMLNCLERQLRAYSWPPECLLWEEHLSAPEQRQKFSMVANLGFSTLACLPAAYVLLRAPKAVNIAAFVVMSIVFGCVVWVYTHLDYYDAIRFFRGLFKRRSIKDPA